ncbi:neurotrophin 1 isoform X2 [Rhodnius prolixus]
MVAALKRPEGRKRLGQVLPIVRLMSPPQRLALASLVMAQVLAGPSDHSAPLNKSENVTSQLMLPISMDIANMFRTLAREQPQGRSSHGFISELYQGGHRIRTATGPNIRRPPPTLNGINRRNVNGNVDKVSNPKRRPGRPPVPMRNVPVTGTRTCTLIANELCLELNDYPEEAVINTIKKADKPEAFKALLMEPTQLVEAENEPKFLERRQGEVGASTMKKHMCASTVEFARPKKARATSGQWKYIVNTGDYTQTLRLELCTKPESPCTFLAEGVDSQCVQVYNYHRLLTWDETSGLTMDVFKVPTCCSCRVLGYGGIPFHLQTLEATTLSNIVDHPDTNLVGNEETSSVRLPPLSLTPSQSPPKGIRVRPFVPPKRETARRPGTILHKGPPLPLEGEGNLEDYRYPPFDNTLRRYTRNNTVDRYRVKHGGKLPVSVTPNQRHPALPIDSLHSDSASVHKISPTPILPTTPGNTVPAKRINYSYHPIIDYFRPQLQQHAESRVGLDWTPILKHPHQNVKPKL